MIPTFNSMDFLQESIECALTQTWMDKEIIVINDGSTDGTSDLLKKYQNAITIIDQENSGLGAARNSGIQIANGTYFAFLDADDRWSPHFITKSVEFLKGNPNTDIVYTWWRYIDKQGNQLPETGCFSGTGNLLSALILSNRFPPMSALTRRKCIEQINGFDENRQISEDWDFWLRLAKANCIFSCLPEVLADYRFHGSNMSLNIPYSHTRYINVLDKLYKNENDLPDEIIQLKNQAYSNVYLNTAKNYLRENQIDQFQDMIFQTFETWPESIFQENTYYELICADQPPGYRNTHYFIDLERSEKLVQGILEKYFSKKSIDGIDLKQRNRALSILWMTLARHKYFQSKNDISRRYLLKAIKHDPTKILKRNTIGLWIRTLISNI